uniref:Uncharacterized protein n=1 Tax=Rhizophora mucronata TaxID=61149 RepID=A0A2P2N122_RHIMU
MRPTAQIMFLIRYQGSQSFWSAKLYYFSQLVWSMVYF